MSRGLWGLAVKAKEVRRQATFGRMRRQKRWRGRSRRAIWEGVWNLVRNLTDKKRGYYSCKCDETCTKSVAAHREWRGSDRYSGSKGCRRGGCVAGWQQCANSRVRSCPQKSGKLNYSVLAEAVRQVLLCDEESANMLRRL